MGGEAYAIFAGQYNVRKYGRYVIFLASVLGQKGRAALDHLEYQYAEGPQVGP
jgi:hypothetical protein